MMATFMMTLSSVDLSFMSSLEKTKLSSKSKQEMKEAKRAARNYTYPGIFTKSAKDFYKSMDKFKDEDRERAMNFMNYKQRFKRCLPQLLTPNPSLLHKLYIWVGIVFTGNTLQLLLRLYYGKLLEHFFPKSKEDRAKDLWDRIKEKRAALAAKIKQALAMA